MARHTPYYDFDGQNNLQTVNTYVMGIPAPIVADRIWDTRANALSYIADANGSAFPGMRLTVIKDSTDDNNGLYYVKPTLNGSGNPVRPYSLVKLTNDINALSLITANSASSVTEITTNQADPYVNLTKKATYDASTYTLVDSIRFSGQKDSSNNDVIKVVGNAGSVAINFPTVSPHYLLAGPSTGSSSAVPSFRQLKIEEIDELDSLGSTTGYLKRIATGTAPTITYSWELGTPSGGGDGTVTEISHGDGIKFRTALDDADLTTITSTGKIKLEFASSSAIGAIKLGFTNDNTNRKYAVQLGANSGESANERAYVQIPTFSGSGTNHKAGLVVDPGSTAGSKKFLREDASWNQVSMENISEVTTNSTSTGYLKRTSSGTAPDITYGWSFVSESNIDTKVTQTGTNTNAGYPILLKYTNNTDNETNTVWFANATNNGATINANSGKITCPGFVLRESGSGITTKKILVGDGTAIAEPSVDATFLKATVSSGTVSFSWDSAGGGTDTWRNVYTGGTSRVGTGTDTLASNFASGNGISVSYEAAGAESGDPNYFNIKYSAKVASTSEIGSIKLGYTDSGRNMSVQLDSTTDKAFVNVPITNTNTTYLAGSNITITDITSSDFTDWVAASFIDEGTYCDITISGVSTAPSPFSGIIRFKTNSIIKATNRYCFRFGSTRASLIDWSDGSSTSENSKYMRSSTYAFYPGTNYYFSLKASGSALFAIFLGTDIKTIASSGSGTDTKTDQTLISNPTGDANNRPLLIAKGTTSSSGTINDGTLFAKNLYYTPKEDTLYVGNITATGNISGTNITASGKFSGIAEITANQYFSSSKYGIDMQNSDIIHANSIFCNDTSEKGEGLHFFRSNNTYDSLRIDNSGLVKFDKGWGYSSGSASGGTTYDVAISASQTASGITVQTAGTTSDKYYPVQTNPDTGMAVVNVPWSGGGGGGSTVSINVPSPVPTIGTSDTTLATVTIDGTSTNIKAKISSSAAGSDPIKAYSLLSGSFGPLEFLCNFFYPIFTDGLSNDISGVTAVRISELVSDPASMDGHIPVGAIIIMYACYLTEIGCTSGRLILETYAYGDYWGYIVCENDADCYNEAIDSGAGFGSRDVLDVNLVNLLTFNWSSYINELPMGINDAVQGVAALVDHNDVIIGGEPDGFYYYHKYIFTFSDIVTGTMYNNLRTNFYQNVLINDFTTAIKEISENAGVSKSGEYFDGMVVSLEHKSCTIANDGLHPKTFGWHQPSRPV